MNFSDALVDIHSFMMEAGALAVAGQASVTRTYKDGQQAVTETDLAISHLAQSRLKHWLQRPGHVLVDEESIDQAGSPADVFAKTDYQWVLDPIDGTAGYALGRNLWGISLGLLEKGRPIIGIIYLPALQRMLIADEKTAWHVTHVGSANETKEILSKKILEVNSQIFVESYFGSGMGWGDGWSDKIWINRPESAVQGFYSALVGQAAGATLIKGYSCWDVAAAAAIASRAGYDIRGLDQSDMRLTCFNADDFQPNWKLSNNWLLSSVENYAVLAAALTKP